MGMLGELAKNSAGGARYEECEWCGRSYNVYNSKASSYSKYCSVKCEQEYVDSLYSYEEDYVDDPPVKEQPKPKTGRSSKPVSQRRKTPTVDPVLTDPDFNLLSDAGIDDRDFIKRSGLDELILKAAYLVTKNQQGSTSMIQRKLSLGYNRAGRIVDQLEDLKVLGIFDLGKGKPVLMDDLDELVVHLSQQYRILYSPSKPADRSAETVESSGGVPDVFWAKAALAVCMDVFGRDNKLSKEELTAFLKEIRKYYGVDFSSKYREDYDHLNEKWQSNSLSDIITRVNELIDFWATDPRKVKLEIMRVIVYANNALDRKESDRVDSKSRFEVYEAFGISVKEYNAWHKEN